MAGGHGGPFKADPAIDRWVAMREDVYKNFRFTPRNTIISIVGLVVFPGLIYWSSASTDLRWKWAGKLKDESLKA